MEIKHLLTFITLAETLSFSRTAKVLYLTHSTVSKHIQSLENELQQLLLERDTRNVTLTPAGSLLYARVKPAVDILEDARRQLSREQSAEEGKTFIIGADMMLEMTPYIVGRIMTGVLRMKKRSPGLDIRVLSIPGAELENKLLRRSIDVSLRVQETGELPANPLFQTAEIYSDRQALIIRRHEGVDYRPDNLRDIMSQYDTAFLSNNNSVYPDSIVLLQQLGIHPRIELCKDLYTIIYKVMTEDGVTIFPRLILDTLDLPETVSLDLPVRLGVTATWLKDDPPAYMSSFLASYAEDAANGA